MKPRAKDFTLAGISYEVDGRAGYKVFRDGVLLGTVVRSWNYKTRWAWFAANGGYGTNGKTRRGAVEALVELDNR